MFYILKIIINIFLSIMSLIGIYFTYKKNSVFRQNFFYDCKNCDINFCGYLLFCIRNKILGRIQA